MTEAELKSVIEDGYEMRADLNPANAERKLRESVNEVVFGLDRGTLRVAEKIDGQWQVNQWLKKAVLLSFKLQDNQVMPGEWTNYYDKVPSKFSGCEDHDFRQVGVRVVPPAAVRRGAYLAPGVVCMPAFVNIGAYVDAGTMIDTWATVGSCAQVGKNVHISGGAGLGGVLEPLQANPTIVEDGCFIGARSEIVEGVIVEAGSVISMGVFIGQSTKIYNRETGEITFGRVPAGSVVVPGSLDSSRDGLSLYCAVIVKQVDSRTREKVSINELLRSV